MGRIMGGVWHRLRWSRGRCRLHRGMWSFVYWEYWVGEVLGVGAMTAYFTLTLSRDSHFVVEKHSWLSACLEASEWSWHSGGLAALLIAAY
jgi:hypothetical protein